MIARRLCAGLLGLLVLAGAGSPAAALDIGGRDAVRVCADPNLLPFSNDRGEGFENRVAEMIGRDLNLPVVYTWWPQTIGFVRNTLRARQCDLMMGTAAGEELVQNTNPYYRSIYALVYRSSANLSVRHLNDPALRGLRVGVIAGTPGASRANRNGITNIEPYQLETDTRVDNPARRAIEDVASGRTDAAIVWGPIAGYFAARQSVPLTVVPLVDEGNGARLDFAITMGVRAEEPEWKHWLNDFIARHKDEINAVLADYHVPLLNEDGKLLEVSTVRK